MKKKFLALVLTLAMVLSLVPVTALATNGLPTPDNDTADATQPRTSVTADTEDGVHISKRVENAADGNYNLVMEAYVEGTTKTTTSTKPLDIVLVLDVSGSMDDSQGWGTDKKITSLKSAVKDFIDEVEEKNTDTDSETVGHRISIVTFADGSQIIKPLTDVGTRASELKTAVDQLRADGATRADLGMQMAQSELSSNGNSSSDKVVVMFTDGSPTSSNGFEYGVASNAISASKYLKDENVQVYTIGIFSGANPQENLNKASKKTSTCMQCLPIILARL